MKPATFKGSVKYAIRHVRKNQYINSARYAKNWNDTPTLSGDLEAVKQQCHLLSSDPYHIKEYDVTSPSDLEIVIFQLYETQALRYS